MTHEERAAEAMRAAIDGEHPFVVVDMDAPMRTCEPIAGGRMRMSPDVWRNLMSESAEAFALPLPIAYEPAPPADDFLRLRRWHF